MSDSGSTSSSGRKPRSSSSARSDIERIEGDEWLLAFTAFRRHGPDDREAGKFYLAYRDRLTPARREALAAWEGLR